MNEAAKIFLPASQAAKNKHIDKMFATCPAVLQFLLDLDKGHPNEANKEVIVQLLAIFFTAATVQKINLKNFDFDEIIKALERNVALKRYFHDKGHPFDGQAFSVFVQQYPQKEVLNYTFFAVNNQFRALIQGEQDVVFSFYIVKSVTDAMLSVP